MLTGWVVVDCFDWLLWVFRFCCVVGVGCLFCLSRIVVSLVVCVLFALGSFVLFWFWLVVGLLLFVGFDLFDLIWLLSVATVALFCLFGWVGTWLFTRWFLIVLYLYAYLPDLLLVFWIVYCWVLFKFICFVVVGLVGLWLFASLFCSCAVWLIGYCLDTLLEFCLLIVLRLLWFVVYTDLGFCLLFMCCCWLGVCCLLLCVLFSVLLFVAIMVVCVCLTLVFVCCRFAAL